MSKELEHVPEVIAPRRDYPLLSDPQAMQKTLRLIEENLGGQKFSPLNLSRIKVPSGDDDRFKVETASGTERQAVIVGVITAFRQARAYWAKAYGTGRGQQPPDCTSHDGFTGIGNPGGDCTTCPLAAFGTARQPDGAQGAGQACKELRQLLILLPGQKLPHMFGIPPTSLQNFTKYTLSLTSAGESYWTVTTRMTLEPAYNAGGVRYARVKFALHGSLQENEAAALAPYHDRMRMLLAPMAVDATAYEVIEDAADDRRIGNHEIVLERISETQERMPGFDDDDKDKPF